MLGAHEPSSVELPPGGGVPLHVLCGTRTAQLVGPVLFAYIDTQLFIAERYEWFLLFTI